MDTRAQSACDPSVVTVLRQEIVESQKSQAEFLKWKLIAASAVAALGLGLTGSNQGAAPRTRLLICLIPLICAYVDLLSLHIVIRIIVIAAFLRRCGDPYENFVQTIRSQKVNPFKFELMALHGSSFVINCLIAGFGVYGGIAGWAGADVFAYTASGLVGALVAAFLWVLFNGRAKEVVNFQLQNASSAAPTDPTSDRPAA